MTKKTGWKEHKHTAATNNVSYAVFLKRIRSGLSPEEAVSANPEIVTEHSKIMYAFKNLKRTIKTEGPMTRTEALEQIDIQIVLNCDPCPTRLEMNKRNGNNSSRLEKICNNECPVGKQIQALSEYFAVKPRKEAPRISYYGIEKI